MTFPSAKATATRDNHGQPPVQVEQRNKRKRLHLTSSENRPVMSAREPRALTIRSMPHPPKSPEINSAQIQSCPAESETYGLTAHGYNIGFRCSRRVNVCIVPTIRCKLTIVVIAVSSPRTTDPVCTSNSPNFAALQYFLLSPYRSWSCEFYSAMGNHMIAEPVLST